MYVRQQCGVDCIAPAEQAALRQPCSVQVGQVAHCMLADAERWHAARGAAGGGAGAEPEVKLFDMKAIQGYA